jgi:hypothetical protein
MNDPMAAGSLTLCPFCNGKPCYLQQDGLHKIRCIHCGAEVKAKIYDNAVRAWNIRARSRQTPMEAYNAQLKVELSPENYPVACGVLDHLIRETIDYLKRREFLPPRDPLPTGAPNFWWRHLNPLTVETVRTKLCLASVRRSAPTFCTRRSWAPLNGPSVMTLGKVVLLNSLIRK